MNELRLPVSGVARNPLIGLMPIDMKPVSIGTPLYELMPDGECVLCQYNGEWVPYEHYAMCVQPGDVVAWHELPQGRDGLRIALTLAVAVAAAYTGGAAGLAFFGTQAAATAAAVAIVIGGNLLINALLPPTSAFNQGPGPGGQIYTTSLQGNQARLNQPIWKVCGRRKIYPPFAAMPYQQWVGSSDSKQYYYALFAATLGNADLESALIGGTPVSHFQDVIVSAKLDPGVQPSRTLANVETSTVVAGNTLESGQYVGGFIACKAKRTCTHVGIDISATRGITQSMTWRVEVRSVNDFGVPLTGWSILATETKTGSTNTPQQWSYRYALPGTIRPEVKLVRTDIKNTDPSALHELAWIGLRGYLAQSAGLDPDTTHYEIVLRASAQLSQNSQRDIALILQGKCRTWNPDTGWSAEVYTRNPAWWALDLATSSIWGLNEPDERVDLQGFADLALICDARQDRFDYCFDTATAAWDALQLIARAARARCFRRNGVLTIARDQLETLPVTAFTSRNTEPDSMTTVETLPARERADGFVIEYEDNRTWQWTPVECPCPDVVSMSSPVHKRIEGITGATHALREGLYEAANLFYRTRQVTCKTEMEGVLPAYMSPVTWQPDIVGYGQTGDVAFWDGSTLVMGLSEPPHWATADLYLRLRRDDGTLTDPVKVTPGPSPNDVVLPDIPDFELVLDDGTRERPLFILGPLIGGSELVKVTAISDGGKGSGGEQLYQLGGLIDDERVHAADNAYLPGPGDIQDPVDTTPDVAESGSLFLVNFSDHWIDATSPDSSSNASFFMNNDGTCASGFGLMGATPGQTTVFTHEWMLFGAVTPTQAALFEVRATQTSPGTDPPTSGDGLGSWLNLGTSRYWGVGGDSYTSLRVEIREVGSTALSASQTVTLVTLPNGGGFDSSGQ